MINLKGQSNGWNFSNVSLSSGSGEISVPCEMETYWLTRNHGLHLSVISVHSAKVHFEINKQLPGFHSLLFYLISNSAERQLSCN